LDEFSKKTPYYVELYEESYSEESYSDCHHPVISLMRVAITNDSNLRFLCDIANGYDFPVMYFQGGKGAGRITLHIPSETNPIKLKNGSKSTIVKKLEGDFHVFDNSSPAIVLEWLKNTGGGVKRFPRIMIIAGCMAARCQSFGSADFNVCLSNKKIAWHLTEMYLSVSTLMDQPELLQTAGRLCVVARDNIQPLLYASKETCNDLIKAFQTQEELIERAKNDEQKESIGKIMESLPMYRKKVAVGRSLTKKANYNLNLVSKKVDAESGGWNKRDVYCSKDVNGNKISASKLQISENMEELLTKLQPKESIKSEKVGVETTKVVETSISRLQKAISKYVGSNKDKNTWRSAKEWLNITGLCGFKSADAHHYGILTKLHKKGFLERNESNLTRVNNI
jgi:hypothetical protein